MKELNLAGRTHYNTKPIMYEEVNGCWVCTSHARNKDGYTVIGRNKKLHRVVCEQYNGELKEGNVVMHTCDNPRCINPAHLRQGTVLDNIQDRHTKGRSKGGNKWLN